MKKSSWIFLVLVLVAGCYNKKEGCLDPKALNFDVSADKNCCCEYPSLVIRANFKQDDTTGYNFFNGYQIDDGGQVYLVKSIRFYLSGIELLTGEGDWLDPKGSSEKWIYDMPNRTADVSDNVLLIKSSDNSQAGISFSEYDQVGVIDKVRMNFGLSEFQNAVIPDSLTENGPLAFAPDSLWLKPNTYIMQEWIVVTDTATATRTIDTFQVLVGGGVLEMDYNIDYKLPLGVNLDLSMDVLVPKWLEGVDWSKDTAIILQKLKENGTSAISLVQL